MTRLQQWSLVLIALLGGGCREVTTTIDSHPAQPQAGRTGGLVEITITGVGNSVPVATARAIPGDPGLPSNPPVMASASRAGATTSPRLTPLTLTGDGTIQLDPVTTGSFTVGTRGAGGKRYVSATYRVRNAQANGTPYGESRVNLTLLAVARNNTLSGTAISQMKRFDGSDANPAIAAQMFPTGAVYLYPSNTISTTSPDVLQAYTEAEVGDVTPPAGVTSVLPYGFVVRNAMSSAARILPVPTHTDQFDGLVTFAYEIPLQATAAADPFTVSALFLAVDDQQTIITQSFEETDSASLAALNARGASLGAPIRWLNPRFMGIQPSGTVCRVRIADPAVSPAARLVDSISLQSVTPQRYAGSSSFIAPDTSFSASFSQVMPGATAATFAVNGSQSGRLFLGGGYGGAGTTTLTTPAAAFRPGEEVEVTLTTDLHPAAGSRIGFCPPQVYRYRVASTAPSTTTFFPNGPFAAGIHPGALGVADVNGDGKLDLVVGSQTANGVTVLLGDGAGVFTPAAGNPLLNGTTAYAVQVADLNADGNMDIVAVDAGGDNVKILLGDGTGGFTQGPGSPIATGATPMSVAVGDMNGDGNLDIVTGDFGGDQATILLGNGAGGFVRSTYAVPVGPQPARVILADVDEDGRLDLVTMNQGANNLTVRLNGATGFGAAPGGPVTLPSAAQSAVAADVNGDGHADLIVTTNGWLNILLGNGAGGFSAAAGSPIAMATDETTAAAGDLNGDQKLDVVVAGHNSNDLKVLLGNGAGGFSAAAGSPYSLPSNTGPRAVAIADVSSDGKLDFITANVDAQNVTVMISDVVSYGLTVTALHGNVVGTGINCPGTCQATYPAGTVVTLASTSNVGWVFWHWAGDCSGTTCSVTMNATRSVQAVYAEGTGLCSGNPQVKHNNGLGQYFFDCHALGTPGVPSSYTLAMAQEASIAWGALSDVATCGTSSVAMAQGSGGWAVWAYSGPLAGRVLFTPGSSALCPIGTDPVWN